jgi:hypothetical protein
VEDVHALELGDGIVGRGGPTTWVCRFRLDITPVIVNWADSRGAAAISSTATPEQSSDDGHKRCLHTDEEGKLDVRNCETRAGQPSYLPGVKLSHLAAGRGSCPALVVQIAGGCFLLHRQAMCQRLRITGRTVAGSCATTDREPGSPYPVAKAGGR